jgi:HTH-type transcriptional regulator/antitoxin HipB
MLPITSPEILGHVLKKHRKDLGLTQIQVGEKFNIRQASISKIESGSAGVNLQTLFRLMSALNLEMHLQDRHSGTSDEVLW